MRKILTTAVSALLFLCVGSGIALAQDDAAEEPSWTPVETFTCNYLDGKSPADLDAVIDEWNDWWDDKGLKSYFAATITPFYFGELAFDFGWLGAWTDGAAMGSSMDVWVNDGSEINAKFFEVIECGSHSKFVSLNVKQPPPNDDDSDNNFLLDFQNCSIEEGKTFEDFMAAQEAWNAYADDIGILGGAWVMFPLAGETDDDYDFKYIHSVGSHSADGANWDLFASGHWRKSSELFDDVLDCDISRVYSATTRRSIESDDD